MLPAQMQATSRESLAALREQLDQAIGGMDAAAISGVAEDLASVARLLGHEPALRRALADRPASDLSRAELVGSLFGKQVGELALGLTVSAAKAKWSTAGDLVDSLNDLSHQAAFGAAERDGSFATVEEELFRFGRTLDSNGDLEQNLSDQSTPPQRRSELLNQLVSGKVHPTTQSLLLAALTNPRAQSIYSAVEALVEDAAARRRRSVAIVSAPLALTPEQEQRLASSLSRIYGREIAVSVDVDKSILGGLRVQVGDDVIDGSVAGQLDDIQRRFAG